MSSRKPDGVLIDEEPPHLQNAAVSIARFAGFDADGRFQVERTGAQGPIRAVSTTLLTAEDVGLPVVIAFDSGDCHRPVIIGRVHERSEAQRGGECEVDRLVIRAQREIELRCGDASIVLTRAGKVLIRGNYVLTRSRGANKIKGAFVDIN
jgi:hypothetical protein